LGQNPLVTMLKSIFIKGLAVVNSLDLELDQGMTVLSGETGAGKSILLTAMKLCLGERADSNLLRPGVEKASITLTFQLEADSAALAWLHNNDLEDELCIIRRTISKNGPSRTYINGQPVNLKTMQALSSHLIGIHGQHAHLELLQTSKQRQLIDNACGDKSRLSDCTKAYLQWKELTDEYLGLTEGRSDNENEKQLLRYQIEELEHANIEQLDYQKLLSEHTRLSNMGKITELAESQASSLYESDNAIHSQISRSIQQLEALSELAPIFSSALEQINEAAILVQEAGHDIRHQLDSLDNDEQQIQTVERTLSEVHDLARKLHVTPETIKDCYLEVCEKLDKIEGSDQRLEQLSIEIKSAEENYQKIAQQLHKQRTLKASELSNSISKSIQMLGLPDGKLIIEVTQEKSSTPLANGLDTIQFNITTNPGMPAQPLAKVASGGELSRISLAIQLVTNQQKSTSTLVFDEVDAGIGGGIAETVGNSLRTLASNRQVICVTHLPQVASQGHQHLFVYKHKEKNQTETRVSLLSNEQRIEEIARMLGGKELSEKTLAHAQEMLENAR